MGTREEFEIQCPYCGKGMLERVAVRLLDDDFIIGTFRCQNCGQDVWVSSRRPVYKPREELKAERWEIALKLNALYNKYYDLRDITTAPIKGVEIVKEHINKLSKELAKLDKKIDKVRLERNENE